MNKDVYLGRWLQQCRVRFVTLSWILLSIQVFGCSSDNAPNGEEGVHTSQTPLVNMAFVESDGLVVMEAEHFQDNTPRGDHSWVLDKNLYASQGLVMKAIPNKGTRIDNDYPNSSPQLDYLVNFEKTGIHYLWIRGQGPSHSDNSCVVGLNGATSGKAIHFNRHHRFARWQNWSRRFGRVTLNVESTGVHTVNVWMREDGFRIDKILLTTNPRYWPWGWGPTESPQEEIGCLSSSDCDDGNPCTDDVCLQGKCSNPNITVLCDDGDLCTQNDVCSDGVCGGTPMDCDDSNVCTQDSCVEGECRYEFVAKPCDDGDACTVDDVCVEGSCQAGTPVVCEDDGNPCTDEVCSDGVCGATYNTAPCDDGDACTTGDVCAEGVCSAGEPVDCDDGDPCTDDVCEEGICINVDNGSCIQCTPVTFEFAMGVDDYMGVTDLELLQAIPRMSDSSSSTLTVDLETGSSADTESQVLIKFESIIGTEVGQIPLDAEIHGATLTVYATGAAEDNVSIHRMLVPWSLGATWASMTDGVSADDAEAVAEADDILEAPGADAHFELDVTDSLLAWLEDPSANFGWALLSDGPGGWDFASSEVTSLSQRPELSVTFCGTVAEPPIYPPVLNAPESGTAEVSSPAALDVSVSGSSPEPFDVSFYGRKQGTQPWSLIVLPGSQNYAENNPEILTAQAQWIVDNREALNIQVVVHQGDIVNLPDSQDQWDDAGDALGLLIDAEIPFTVAPGDRDHVGFVTDGPTDLFSETFPASLFEAYPWRQPGSDFNNNNNSYITLNIAGQDYLFISLDYCPDDEEIAWAQSVIGNYPWHRTVLITHALIDDYGEYDGGACGSTEYIWYNLISPNLNLRLVLSGHMNVEDGESIVTRSNIEGLQVHQLLADYQGRSDGGNGRLRIMTFDPVYNQIQVQTYSPVTGEYETDGDSQFTLGNFPMYSVSYDWESLGTVSGLASGDNAAVTWSDLEPDTGYEWYAEVTSGAESLTGDVWTFTTAP